MNSQLAAAIAVIQTESIKNTFAFDGLEIVNPFKIS